MPVIGIDLGCLGTKVATIGRGGVAIVRNDLADRVTPTLVGYTDNERLIGDAAQTSLKSNAARTVRNAKHFLGVAAEVPEDASVIETERAYALAPVTTGEDGQVCFSVGRESGPVSAVEVLVPFLKKVKSMADSYIGAGVTGCVLSIPTWFSEVHRAAALDACSVAGLPCLKVMQHSTATALDYGLFRRSLFTDDTDHSVVFIDTGYGQTTVTLASYTPAGLTIVNTAEDAALGGRALDKILLQHLVAAFKSSAGVDVSKNVKALLKLEEAAEKAKKVLSANRETGIHLECLAEDMDLDFQITREEFTDLIGGYTARIADLVTRVLTAAGVTDPAKLASVEIVGGGTRVPAVQQKLEAVLGRPVSRTLSADECVARGAAVQAAMLDPRHRVKPYDIRDIRQEGLALRFSGPLPGPVTDERNTPVRVIGTDILVFAPGLQYVQTASRILVLPVPKATTTAVEFDVGGVRALTQTDTAVPLRRYGTVRLELSADVRKAIAEAAQKCRFEIKAAVDVNGMASLEGVMKVEVVTEQEVVERMPKRDEKGEIIDGEFDEVKTMKPKTIVKTHKLTQSVVRAPGFLSAGLKLKYAQNEAKEAERDHATTAARTMRNEILSKAFTLREYASSDRSAYEEFITPADRQLFLQVSEECEQFAEENEGLTCAEYAPYAQKLQSAWEPVETRFRSAAQKAAEEEAAAKRAAEEALAAAQKAAAEQAAAEAAAAAAAAAPPASEPEDGMTEDSPTSATGAKPDEEM